MDHWDYGSSSTLSKCVEEPDQSCESVKDDDCRERDVESPEFNAAIRKEVEVAVIGTLPERSAIVFYIMLMAVLKSTSAHFHFT